MTAAAQEPILRVEHLTKHYPVQGALPWSPPRAHVHAVDGVSFDLFAEQTLSVVGESGCGKTTTAKVILRIERPTSGAVTYAGDSIHTLQGPALAAYRRAVQAVFQNPFSSLNPRMRIGDIVGEPRVVAGGVSGAALRAEVGDLLEAVGLPRSAARAYPHELSGGMRQRVAIARALSLRPSLIVLDEPVSALDVSIRAQIINLLKDLQQQFGIAYLLIAHDLATTRYLSHRVAVMYLGQIVESGTADEVFDEPRHPYTQALIAAVAPVRRWEQRAAPVLDAEPPSAVDPPAGCRFHTRCPLAFARCSVDEPRARAISPTHAVACHLYDERIPEDVGGR